MGGKGGTVLLIHPDFVVTSSGTLPEGRGAWAKISNSVGSFNVVGVYAPNLVPEREAFWRIFSLSLPTDNWIITGDFNMTEVAEDSSGDSPLISGTELDEWRLFHQRFNLIDTFDVLGSAIGARFTRRAKHGDRFDQSRLDRFYVSDQGWWIDRIKKLEHFGGQVLSDHDPIALTFRLSAASSGISPAKKHFFKANPIILKNEENILELKKAWEEHDSLCTDPCIRLAFSCKRLRKKYKELQKKIPSIKLQQVDIQNRISTLKTFLALTPSQEEIDEYNLLTSQLRALQFQDAVFWRRESRIRWLGLGDASTKFFFNTVKEKHKKEQMNELRLDDGSITTDKERITQEVGRFYYKLYTPERETSAEDMQERQEILQRCQVRLSDSARILVEAPPTKKEITDTLLSMPNNKSPGIDGLTAEVFKACWSFIISDFFDMITSFWESGVLYPGVNKGVIKLIPKKTDKIRLKDWRPLTMLSIPYKIINKLIAGRTQKVLPLIVNQQQTGFVKGRHILNNVSTAWLLKDWLEMTKTPALFLGLDFEKAFDLVKHDYLWDTLKALGLGGKYSLLLKGLIKEARAKVHINGSFTEEILMARGVRQGCPLAPLLFAMASQPLMAYLDDQLLTGRLHGIQVHEALVISYMLFADDLGMFVPASESHFNEVISCLRKYEAASGSKLNLQKSIIVPFCMESIPNWLSDLGCEISEEGKVQKYLGAPFGTKITPMQVQQFCLNGIRARLSSWTLKTISFSGRVLLIKQVLMAIPVYHMMYVSISKNTSDQIRRMCCDFLWGFNTSGRRKTVLVAWEKLTRSKTQGGLSIKDTKIQSTSLLARWANKALAQPDSDWSSLYIANLKLAYWENKKIHKRLNYSIHDKILFGNVKTFGKLTYTAGIWRAWVQLRPFIRYNIPSAKLPSHWRTEDVIPLFPSLQPISQQNVTRVCVFLGTLGVRTVGDLWDHSTSEWRQFGDHISRSRNTIDAITILTEKFLLDVKSVHYISFDLSSDLSNWDWGDASTQGNPLMLTSKKAYDLLDNSTADIAQLNRRWEVDYSHKQWETRWKLLWASDLSNNARTFIWKVLAHALFTNSRAATMGVATGDCGSCPGMLETPLHLFFQCPYARDCWMALQNHTAGVNTGLNVDSCTNLIELLDHCAGINAGHTAKLFLIYETLWSIWNERNKLQFEGKVRSFSPTHIAKLAADNMDAIHLQLEKGKTADRLQLAKIRLHCGSPAIT